ncbi:hypothetical protein C8J55DRAFT_533549 [Lentinula edodes]|uniref:Integrase catalytic domain-containing protein n=1 Tax=Lentinula lateritia TaxID=40482 RepID=A0A9W9AYZ5_9AGAR|nr:hypothetical protein C8J55DRAFT_533549 [Lentinula edodes]
MAKDPNGQRGPRIIKERIALDQGIHLTRLYVENTMRAQDPEGFHVLICIGPHQEWSGDGHDKLAGIGFPIWGVRDVWSGKWLGLWVVPNNRLKDSIAYLFLKLVHEYGGIPVQMTTDCGSELVSVYGFANALREAFVSDLPIEELAAHRFLQSIHNITIERGWLPLRLEWGENVKIFWDAGSTTELDHLRDAFNNHRVRKDRGKALPSSLAPNVSFSLYEKYGGENGLLPVDCTIVKQLMENIGGEDLIRFVSRDYAAKAQAVFVDQLGNPKLTMTNVWDIFQEMLPCI